MFRFVLVDRVGHEIKECWEVNEKRAWDQLIDSYYEKK